MTGMGNHPILDRDRQQVPEPMSEADMEDFLTEAIGLYAEQTRTEVDRLRTLVEAGLLFNSRGLVVGIGGAEFRISIVRSR
jgi:hypothetical protein